MWDFSIGRTIAIVARTWPFVAFRMLVYFGITVAYTVATGAGAGVGYGTGFVFNNEEGPLSFAVWGGFIGFGLVSVFLYWIREYILYIVKAGHIAVMVQLIDGNEVPGGQGQIAYAHAIVRERFVEANVLFAIDQLVKGVIVTITGLVGGIAALLPIPGLNGLVRFANAVIRMALTYVDEIVLGYNVRLNSHTPYDTARTGVILYAQNSKVMLKNALWLTLLSWVLGIVVFFSTLAPASAILYAMPGQLAGWAFVLSIVFAWACISAFIEPFAIAALLQVYFKTIAGQVPDPEWEDRLNEASRHFRELTEKAMTSIGGPRWGSSAPEQT